MSASTPDNTEIRAFREKRKAIYSDKEGSAHKDLSATSIHAPKDIVLLLVKLTGSRKGSGECFSKRFPFSWLITEAAGAGVNKQG